MFDDDRERNFKEALSSRHYTLTGGGSEVNAQGFTDAHKEVFALKQARITQLFSQQFTRLAFTLIFAGTATISCPTSLVYLSGISHGTR